MEQNGEKKKKYIAVLTENGVQVCQAKGTLMEMANWADNVIRMHGNCTIDIRQESA